MEVANDDFMELQIGDSVESLQRFLASQRELFHSQIDQFQGIVVTQCKLTGVNPLSQEMAAGALSIKIGKRPRDLLNPKAVNYMQSVFSIKDAISKKECREIGALFGVTVTQVRDFFNSQRSRVRRLVQLSRDRALRSNSIEEPCNGSINSDSMMPIDQAPLNTVIPTSTEEASCSTPEAALFDLDNLDKQFVDNIFSLMEKEETFSGQEKLMEWILTIQNFSVLLWFLTRGGVIILAAWLSNAAIEEQTSVLLLILKVLCHLPLHKALPTHISATLQSVNKLRFYRTSEISNRARVLLSKWSKLLARDQAMKKPNGVKSSSDGQKGIMLSQSIGQIMGSEAWDSNIDAPEDILALSSEDNFRRLEPSQTLKLLPPSSDDSNKKPALGASSSQSRERRKVQFVEQPGQRSANRSPQVTRVGSINRGRPMSADDIQKAKMRALFMQSKYGKAGASKENKETKIDGLHKHQIAACSSKVPPPPKIEEDKKPLLLPSNKSPNKLEASYAKLKMDVEEPLWEKCKRVQITWKTPAEVKLGDTWSVSAGENSKEVVVQTNRNRREKETIYLTVQEIPSNPKEPWDLEMDYDDTLTPEIPIEQLPDVDGAESPVSLNQVAAHAAVQGVAATTTPSTSNAATAQPDLELLAVLLKNPELVFALTTGQTGGIPSDDTVKLLDMIKRGGLNVGLNENTNGNGMMSAMAKEEKVEVSLPSPTPSSDPTHPRATTGWSGVASKNPFSRQIHSSHAVATTNLISQIPATGTAVRQQPAVAIPSSNPFISKAVSPYPLPQATNVVPERQPHFALSSVHVQQTQSSDIVGLTMKNNTMGANASSAHLWVDGTSNVKPVHHNMSVQEGLSNSYSQSFRLDSPTRPSPLSAATQQQRRHAHFPNQAHFSEPSSYRNTARSSYLPPSQIENPGPVSDSWRVARQDASSSSSYYSQQNQNNNYNNTFVGGSMQQPGGPSWDRNNHATRQGFESWSPENSPSRNPRYAPARNYPESRMNQHHGRNNRPEYSRQRGGGSGNWDPSRQGNRKWQDQRR